MKGLADSHPLGEGTSRVRLLRDPLPLCNLPQMNSVNSTDQTGGVVELDFDKSISDGVNIYAKRDGDADFVFLARDTASPYVDNRPLLVATKPELREYKALYVQSDAEIGLFSDEVVVNCAP